MVEDQTFLDKSRTAAGLYLKMTNGDTSIQEVKRAGEDLSSYMIEKFPNGYAALENYATLAAPEVLRREVFPRAGRIDPDTFNLAPREATAESIGVVTDVALAAEVVVNLAVSANVVIVSHAAAAVVAVVVVGVVVA